MAEAGKIAGNFRAPIGHKPVGNYPQFSDITRLGLKENVPRKEVLRCSVKEGWIFVGMVGPGGGEREKGNKECLEEEMCAILQGFYEKAISLLRASGITFYKFVIKGLVKFYYL